MKKSTALLSTSALVAMSLIKISAKADSSNFSGGFASLGGSVDNSDVDFSNNAGNIPAATIDSSTAIEGAFVGFETSATTIIGRAAQKFASDEDNSSFEATVGYNVPIDDKFLIGLDLTASTGGLSVKKDTDYTRSTVGAGTAAAAASMSISTAAGIQTTTYEEDESYSIGIRPSYAIDDKTLVYGRISAGTTKATLKTSYNLATDTTANKTVSEDLDNYGLGLGVVHNINNSNLFIDASLNYRKTDEIKNSIDDSGQTASITSASLSSATNTLTTTAENESYGASIKVGIRF